MSTILLRCVFTGLVMSFVLVLFEGKASIRHRNMISSEDKIEDALKMADKLLETQRCKESIETLLKKAVPIVYAPSSNQDEQQFLDSIQSVSAVSKAYHQATRIINIDEVSPARHRATSRVGEPGQITFWKDYFYQAERDIFIINDQNRITYSNRSLKEMAQTSIHEGIHLILGGGTDVVLGEIILGKTILSNDMNERVRKGSEIITEKIAHSCR